MGRVPLSRADDLALRRLLADERDLTWGSADDLAFWRDVSHRRTGPILELGCGAGRILTALSAPGHMLTGVDLDPIALRVAAERSPSARWIRADGRDWRGVPTAAALVVIGGDLLSVIVERDDLVALLRTAKVHSAPGGVVGLDATLMDPHLLRSMSGAEWGEDLLREDPDLGTVWRESRIVPDPDRRPNTALLEIRHRSVDKAGRSEAFYPDRGAFPVRAWRPDEVEAAVEAVGLQIEQVVASDRLRWLLRSSDE